MFSQPKYQLNIKATSNQAIEYYTNFASHHNGDSGIDLYHFDEVDIPFLQVGTVNFEIQCEMINLETGELCSYYLYPRSSISKTSFQLANSVGIIDAGYRGNIMAKIRCFGSNGDTLQPGTFFQITSPDLMPIRVNMVESLSGTSRGSGGFGSTNVSI